jgi:serine/threonine protein kinase
MLEPGMAQAGPEQVFISYAHEDRHWRDAFARMLDPACRAGRISLWSDVDIEAGRDWFASIERALARARVGLLLVSPHFLQSEFINTVELERLLSAAARGGVTLRWIPVSASLHAYTPLARFQAAWDPERPLDALPDAERSGAIQQICARIVDDVGTVRVGRNRRENMRRQIEARLGDKYELGDEAGAGKLSVVYKARQRNGGRTVGVKAFVASELDDWARQTFITSVERAMALTTPSFIRILDSSLEESPECLVSEFVEGEPLSKFLSRYPAGVPLPRVKSILLDLTTAIEEIHGSGWLRGEFCSSNIMIDRSGTARLSPVIFSTLLADLGQLGGNFVMDRELLAYMTPEHYFGHERGPLTDQYSLAIIATELLGCEPVPRVSAPSDLGSRRFLFEHLESARGAWAQRSSELVGIVSRMLRIDPAERWPSMRDVRNYLREIEVAESPVELHRKTAKASYLRLQSRGIEGLRSFFEAFYRNLFEACPDVEAHFRPIDMERQYRILNNAVHVLLEFDPDAPGAREHVSALASKHAGLGLTRRHYELFLESLARTLAESQVCGEAELDAWRETLRPAIEFMGNCQPAHASTANLAQESTGSPPASAAARHSGAR